MPENKRFIIMPDWVFAKEREKIEQLFEEYGDAVQAVSVLASSPVMIYTPISDDLSPGDRVKVDEIAGECIAMFNEQAKAAGVL